MSTPIIASIVEEAAGTADAVDQIERLSIATKQWIETHRTRSYPLPISTSTWQVPGTLRLSRPDTDSWGESFDLLLGSLLSDMLVNDSSMGVALHAHADETTTAVTVYVGMVKDLDDDAVTFYDDVVVPRAFILAVGV